MNKRFNIRAAFEEAKEAQATAQLEVDKEAAMSPEEKAIRDSALQLASTTDESAAAKEKEAETVDAPIDATNTDAVDDVTPEPTVEPIGDSEDSKTTPAPTEAPVEEAKTDTEEATITDNEVVDFDPDSEEGKEKAKQDQLNKEMEEDAVVVKTTLENLSEIVKRSLDKGGLTTMSAGAVALVLQQQYNRVGMTYNSVSYPATESYASVSIRKRNTEIALESIDKAIARIRSSIEKSVSKRTKKVAVPIASSPKAGA